MEATLRGLRNEMAPPTENVVEINSNHMISTYVYQYIYIPYIDIIYIYIHISCVYHIYHKMISFRSAKGDWKQEETDTKRKRK